MSIAIHIPNWLIWAGGVISLVIVGMALGIVLLNLLFKRGFGGPWR